MITTAKTALFSGNGIPITFMVAGGGGGGGCLGGGGGGGGMIESTFMAVRNRPYSVLKGAGGSGASANVPPTSGSPSTFIYTMQGGGSGGHTANTTQAPANGGSGGGSWRATSNRGLALDSRYGNNGGQNLGTGAYVAYMGGGGGGAGAAGGDGSGAASGAGGAGRLCTFNNTYYAGGGGGGGSNSNGDGITITSGAGGIGGATSGTQSNTAATAAAAGTASGGGSGGYIGLGFGNGGNGGSGAIVFKLPIKYTVQFGAGTSATVDNTTYPGYNVISITSTSTGSETITIY